MAKSRFDLAENNVRSYFQKSPYQAFSLEVLRGILEEQRQQWNLPVSMTSESFVNALIGRGIIEKIEIPFEGYVNSKERFITKDATVFHIATSLINRSYLSHYSALFIHGLTLQVPKTIYITFDQSPKHQNVSNSLTQQAIDQAFSKPQREAGSKGLYGDYTFVALNGKHSGRLGIYHNNSIPITNVERTLIDIAVRPSYSGGVSSVLEAYRKALEEKKVSVNKLIAILESMDFVYPYSQAIGFYLEKAGYSGAKLEELHGKNSDFDFYLTYAISEKAYSPKWKLYHPSNL
jgi:hypothetical protein